MGSLLGPAGGIYHDLGERFAADDIATIRVGYRRPNHFPYCVHDLAAAADLARAGRREGRRHGRPQLRGRGRDPGRDRVRCARTWCRHPRDAVRRLRGRGLARRDAAAALPRRSRRDPAAADERGGAHARRSRRARDPSRRGPSPRRGARRRCASCSASWIPEQLADCDALQVPASAATTGAKSTKLSPPTTMFVTPHSLDGATSWSIISGIVPSSAAPEPSTSSGVLSKPGATAVAKPDRVVGDRSTGSSGSAARCRRSDPPRLP